MAKKYPASIKDLDFSTLRGSQVWTLADWMGCLARARSCKTMPERYAMLKEEVERNPAHAQEGYAVIVLRQSPGSAKPANDGEKRFLEMATSVVQATLGDVEMQANSAVDKKLKGIEDDLRKVARRLLAEAAEKAAPFVIKDRGKVRKVKGVLPPEFKRMVELANARVPLMLVGPAGCGKTYLCEKLAEALDLEVSDQSCSEGMSESVFNGRLLPIGRGGTFEHVPSPFMQRYEKGGIMLLDEIDAGDPNLFTYINKAIANRSYTVEQRWTKPVVKKHDDFVLVAAANTYGSGADAMYVGRNQLDAATLDRFKVGMITMDYSKEVELSIGGEELCAWAWKVRNAIRQNKLRRVMSTRVIKDLATMTDQHDWKKDDWQNAYFSGWTDAELALVAGALS